MSIFRKLILIVLSTITLSMTSGCATRVADLTVASTKNINLNSKDFIIGARVSGEDKKYTISFLDIGTPNLKEAVDQAIEQDPCAVGLANMKMDHEQFLIPYVWGYSTFRAEGNLVIDKTLPGCEHWNKPLHAAIGNI